MPSETQIKKATYQSFRWLLALAVATFAAIWITKQLHPPAVTIVAPVMAILVMGCSLLLGRRVQGTLDEVHLASQAAANSKGISFGGMIALGLLMLPPVTNGLTDLVYMLGDATPGPGDRAAVRKALVFGAVIVMLTQTLVTITAAVIWWRRTGGASEQT